MTQELTPIDIAAAPDLSALIEAVTRTHTPQTILRNGRPVARIVPVAQERRSKKRIHASADKRTSSLAAAGAWKGIVDGETLKRELDEARSSSDH